MIYCIDESINQFGRSGNNLNMDIKMKCREFSNFYFRLRQYDKTNGERMVNKLCEFISEFTKSEESIN